MCTRCQEAAPDWRREGPLRLLYKPSCYIAEPLVHEIAGPELSEGQKMVWKFDNLLQAATLSLQEKNLSAYVSLNAGFLSLLLCCNSKRSEDCVLHHALASKELTEMYRRLCFARTISVKWNLASRSGPEAVPRLSMAVAPLYICLMGFS